MKHYEFWQAIGQALRWRGRGLCITQSEYDRQYGHAVYVTWSRVEGYSAWLVAA